MQFACREFLLQFLIGFHSSAELAAKRQQKRTGEGVHYNPVRQAPQATAGTAILLEVESHDH